MQRKEKTPSSHITQGRLQEGSPGRAPSASPAEIQAELHAQHTNDMGRPVQGQVDDALEGHDTAL